ncbi:MAG TPA: low temperature requirement protein A [Nocardioidaceae bacterium]|nr:low temperature requirement protein A [Nocardioidaceae bacterium]
MATPVQRLRVTPTTADATVTPLELFFDLVFVFALTQVTAMMADDLTGEGILRGMLVLALLWWSWTGYAWLSNVVRADEGAVRLVLITAMAAMFVLALSIPESFDDLPGGLHGPVVLAVCYFLFRLMHLVMFWVIARGDPGLRAQLLRFTPSMIGGTALLLVASTLDGTAQTLTWAAALAADYLGTLLAGSSGWRLRSPSHFAERHGLILIVALGESIVAIGVGVAELPISWPIVVASVLGLVLASALWWTYFDISALKGELALAQEPEATRAALARDAYSYFHVPLVAGVVLTALGLKKVLEYVGDSSHHDLSDPLKGVALYALFGGVIVYLLGHVGFKWRTGHTVAISRLFPAAVITVLIPIAAQVPALLALTLLTVIMVATVTFETVRYAEHRHELRAGGHPS